MFDFFQISYGASSSLISDKSIYSTFFRTCPSEKQLTTSLSSLIANFGWSCINIITSGDRFFLGVAASLKQDLKSHNVCVTTDEVVEKYNEIPRIVLKIKHRRSVAVNIILTSEDVFANILQEVKKRNLKKMAWIRSGTWSDDSRLVKGYDDVIDGMLLMSEPEEDLGEFKARVRWVSRNISGAYCAWLNKGTRWPGFCDRDSPRQGNLLGLKSLPLDKIAYVMNAVLAIGYGLEHLTLCDSPQSHGSKCMTRNFSLRLARKLLLRSLENNSFSNNRNVSVSFNVARELNAQYDIINLRVTSNNTLTPFRVGEWTQHQGLVMNESDIRWPGNETEVPYSGCREHCPLGTYTKYGFGACWWSCHKCPYGTYNSNYTANTCKLCPKEKMPNELQSTCVDKPLTMINSGEFLAIILLSASGLGEMLTLLVLSVIVRYQGTPVVKATNLTFTVLSLIVLLAWFLLPVLYIGAPSDVICKLRTVSFAVLYTAITSVLLTKTNRLIKIFSAINVKKHPFLSNCWYGFLTCALILVQLGLSVFHLTVFPPKLVYDYSAVDALVITCNENLALDIASLGYNTMLSITCSYLAYQSRNLPGAYNEFKWICLAMFSNFISWLTIFVNRHISPVNKTNLLCTTVALILGAYFILFLLFLPKVCVIFFRPEKNTKQAAIASTRRYSLEQASGIDLSPVQGGPRRNTSPACLAMPFMNGAFGKLPVTKSSSLGLRRSQGSIIATIRECSEERKSSV